MSGRVDRAPVPHIDAFADGTQYYIFEYVHCMIELMHRRSLGSENLLPVVTKNGHPFFTAPRCRCRAATAFRHAPTSQHPHCLFPDHTSSARRPRSAAKLNVLIHLDGFWTGMLLTIISERS